MNTKGGHQISHEKPFLRQMASRPDYPEEVLINAIIFAWNYYKGGTDEKMSILC
jgi:hypothetical protein